MQTPLIRLTRVVLGESHPEISLIVIGAQKAGTTSLYQYLSYHPDIEVPMTKEINYFTSLGNRLPSSEEYLTFFPTRNGRNTRFSSVDISPTYLLDATNCSKNIHRFDPNTKIVAILREPTSRAISSWFMYKKYYEINPNWFFEANWVINKTDSELKIHRRSNSFGKDFGTDIEEEIDVLNSGGRIEFPIVEFGLYKAQLSCYFDLFGHDNTMVVNSDELKRSTQACLNRITAFAGLQEHELEPRQLAPSFVGDNKHNVPPDSIARLKQFYQDQNNGLEELIGQQFDWMQKTD